MEVPKNVYDALEDPKWRGAVMEEMNALNENKTWDVVDLPDGEKVVGCKWIFTIKLGADGNIGQYKARLVAQEYTQTYGVDYEETFASAIRVLISLAANLDWELHQMDVKNAFLNGNLKEEVYMKLPPRFEEENKSGRCSS